MEEKMEIVMQVANKAQIMKKVIYKNGIKLFFSHLE